MVGGFRPPNGLQAFLRSPIWDPDLVRDKAASNDAVHTATGPLVGASPLAGAVLGPDQRLRPAWRRQLDVPGPMVTDQPGADRAFSRP
jgi:hypothetical protein